MRRRFWFETTVATLTAVLACITAVWPHWIEVTGWDPDHSNGTLEWLVVAALATVALGSALLARAEWRRRPARA